MGLDPVSQDRVDADNFSSDFLLALQHWGNHHNLACLRENPLRSLHWWDPVEQFVYYEGEWFDLDCDACVFGGARRKAQKFRHNVPELASLPAVRCGQDHLLADLQSLHFKNLVCDCPHNVLCHGDILRALVWSTSPTTSSSGRRHSQPREHLRRVSLVAAGIRPARAVPLRFSQEIVVASLMALCPEVNWDGFKWPMLKDLLVDDSHFQWLNYMQNRPDWDGHSFGPQLVGPLERTAIVISGPSLTICRPIRPWCPISYARAPHCIHWT